MRRSVFLFLLLLATPAFSQDMEIKLPFCRHNYDEVVAHLGKNPVLYRSTSVPNSSGRYEWFVLADNSTVIVSVLTLLSNRTLGLPEDWVCALNREFKKKTPV